MRLVVLGATGMLGSEVVRVASKSDFEVVAVSRTEGIKFDVSTSSFAQLAEELSLGPADYVINCIGWIPQKSSGSFAEDLRQAELLNVKLPQQINKSAEELGFQWIQIGTDCVFDGSVGDYLESSERSAADLYGNSKVEGERASTKALLIRASIIGPDHRSSSGLYSWFKNELRSGREVIGYANHFWNGVSTTAFAHLVVGLMNKGTRGRLVAHWVPLDKVSKYELLRLFAESLGASPDAVKSGLGREDIDRTLACENSRVNEELWRMAGYHNVPSIRDLVTELVRIDLEQRN